jgi:DNA-binding response OmpR family regulator
MRLLLIDDEDDIREVAALSLETVGGFDVMTASDGRTGVRVAAEERPDAILLDVMMPGLDGPGTYALLRDGEETRSIPVIFMTAKAQQSDHVALSALGACGVITKPFDPMALAARITEILEENRAVAPTSESVAVVSERAV